MLVPQKPLHLYTIYIIYMSISLLSMCTFIRFQLFYQIEITVGPIDKYWQGKIKKYKEMKYDVGNFKFYFASTWLRF